MLPDFTVCLHRAHGSCRILSGQPEPYEEVWRNKSCVDMGGREDLSSVNAKMCYKTILEKKQFWTVWPLGMNSKVHTTECTWSQSGEAILFLKKRFIYLFIQREWERGKDTSRLHAGSPVWDSIPGLQDHTPGCRRRQTAAPPGLPVCSEFLNSLKLVTRVDFT